MTNKILVVDDERKMIKLVRTYLESVGFQVLVAYDFFFHITVPVRDLTKAVETIASGDLLDFVWVKEHTAPHAY